MQTTVHSARASSSRTSFQKIAAPTLRKLYVGELRDVAEVAKELQVSQSNVESELVRHGIPRRTPAVQKRVRELRKLLTPDETVETIVRLYTTENLSEVEIAKQLSLSTQTVGYHLRNRVIRRKNHFQHREGAVAAPTKALRARKLKYDYTQVRILRDTGRVSTVSLDPELTNRVQQKLGSRRAMTKFARTAALAYRDGMALTCSGFVAQRMQELVQASQKVEDTPKVTSKGPKTKHVVNESFFDKWTPEMAWVLGLMATDGHVGKCGRAFYLTSKDYDMLHNVRELLGFSGNVHRCNTAWRLSVCRKSLCDALAAKGIVPRKTFTVDWGSFPAEFHRHFLRGLWDGDGGVCLSRHERYLALSFTSGSHAMAFNVWCALKGALPLFSNGQAEPLIRTKAAEDRILNGKSSRQQEYFVVTSSTKASVQEFYDYLYKGVPHTQCLARKRKLFETYLELEEIREQGRVDQRLH